MSKHRIDILLPGLFDRLSEWRASFGELPDCRELARLFARATPARVPAMGYEATLWSLFDATVRGDDELPVGAVLSALGGATVCRADPVCLKPGVADALLYPVDGRALSPAHRAALVDCVNDALTEWGGSFVLHPDGAGYLSLRDTWSLRTTPPSLVAGRAISRQLPTGEARAQAHRLINHLQMALHDAPFNREREALGALPVNSLWLWGCGVARTAPECRYRSIHATEPLALALAARCGPGPYVAAEPHAVQESRLGPVLVVIDDLWAPVVADDVTRWCEVLPSVATRVSELCRSTAKEIRIFPCDGRVISMRAADRLKFWRKIPPLHHWVQPT